MKAAKVLYLKNTQSHFNEAMRLSGEHDGIKHACAEIAAYIDAHQAAGVYMPDSKCAIMYCAGVKIILKSACSRNLWIIVAVHFIGHMPSPRWCNVLKRIKHGACEAFLPRRGSLALAGIASAMRRLMGSTFSQKNGEGSDASEGVFLSNTEEHLGKRKKIINNTNIPQHQIEAIARCILPDILAFYESEEGQREFAEWKKQREAERQGTKARA